MVLVVSVMISVCIMGMSQIWGCPVQVSVWFIAWFQDLCYRILMMMMMMITVGYYYLDNFGSLVPSVKQSS